MEDKLLHAVEDITPTKKRLKIEIPSDVIEKEIKDSLERLRQKTSIPGFRLGRAPLNLIERRFGKKVEAEVLERVIPEFYREALKEANITPITLPVLDENLDFKRKNPVSFSLTIEVMPKIENINYSDLRVKDILVAVEEVEIEEALKKLQDGKAIYETAEKEIGKDDLVTFDYIDCKIVGEEITRALKEQILKMGNEILPMDIEEKLMGKKSGESVEINNTFDKGYRVKELAGKTLTVTVTIKEVKRKILPTIDDELAKDLGYENLQELREKVRENIDLGKKEQAVKIQKAEILDKLVESHEFEVPETMLANEMQMLLMRSRIYKIPETEEKKIDNEIPPEIKQEALRNIKASIITNAIGEQEGVIVTEDELKERIRSIAERLSTKPEAVMKFYTTKDGSLEGLRHSIFEEKVLELLFSKAVIEKGE
jgi:trigger factor